MPKKGANISLSSYDDIFSTEESRKEAAKEQVQQIPISELHPFEGHPFRVVDDESMTRTMESIAQFGVISPLLARPDPDGGYEIISGHRRIMMLLKLPFKLIALPVALAVTVAQWAGVFLTSFAGAVFYILSGLFFLIAVLGYLMGVHTGSEAVRMLGIAFVVFALPAAAGWLIGKVATLNEMLWDFIKS